MLRPGMAPVIPESTPSTATVDKLAEEAQKSLFQAADQSGGAAPTTSNAPNTTTGPMRLPSPVAGSPALWENDSQHKLAVMEIKFGGTRETVMFELYPQDAPQTVSNFLDNVETDAYKGLAFHRALAEHGVATGYVEYPLEGHGVRSFPAQIDFSARMVGWFEHHLAAIPAN